jgi:transcription antitermination factor NusG
MHMKKTKTETKKVTEEVKKDPRASETREATKRPVEWTPPSSLDAPPAPDGFRHRWIRAESLGFDDTKNIAGKLRSGYVLVMASEYKNTGYPVVQTGKHKGVIGVGGLLLARIPNEIAEARQKYYADKAKERDDAVKSDLAEGSAPEHAYQL